jgi:alcohol dehydrogenase class IV
LEVGGWWEGEWWGGGREGGQRREGGGRGEGGERVAEILIEFMKQTGMPSGLAEVGFREDQVEGLAARAFPQARVIGNAPVDVTLKDLEGIYKGAWSYW